MAINRYDSPAQDRYFNTYVPLPFEQMMPVAAARLSQLQREQDMLNKQYEDTANLEYITNSKDEEFVKDYIGRTGDLVQKYFGQDLTDPIVKQQMLSQFRGMTDRPRLKAIQTSAVNWKQNLNFKAQLKAQGLYDESLDEDPAVGWDSSKGVYQYITSPYKNPRPSAEQFFNNMEASDWTDKEGVVHRGISRSDINRVAEAKWGDFADTSEGRLYIKKIAKEQGIDPNNVAERKRIAMEYLKGVGEEKVHSTIAPGQLGGSGRAPKSGEIGAFNPFKTPTINLQSEGLLGDKKYTANRVYKKTEELASDIKVQEDSLDKLVKSGADEQTILQAKLNLESTKRDYDLFNGTVASAKRIVEKRYIPTYKEAENTFKKAMSVKGVPYDVAEKGYNEYLALLKLDQTLKGNKEGEINQPWTLKRHGYKEVSSMADVSIGAGSGIIALLSNIATKVEMFPKVKEDLSREIGKVLNGKQTLGEGLKKAFSENRELYDEFLKKPVLDKESMHIGSKIRDDVVKYHNKIIALDKRKQKDIDETVETGGLKSKSSIGILPIPSDVDQNGQMYIIGKDKGKISDKSIESISTLTRRIKDNPNSFALIQESGVSKDSNKPKNQETEDLQNSIRSADYILPAYYTPNMNDDGRTYDLAFTTYHKPAKGEKPVATRIIKVRLNRSDQIESVARLINEAGYPATAARVANPDIDKAIKSELSSKEIKVEPYPGFGEYIIRKQEKGWQIFYPDGTPALVDDISNEELGTLNNIEDVIDYMYQVRIAVANKVNIPQ